MRGLRRTFSHRRFAGELGDAEKITGEKSPLHSLTAIYEMSSRLYTVLLGVPRVDLPAALVVLLSLIIGLLMVVVFRYTSDQKAIRLAKDQLKAHVLAVRVFHDQLPVVLSPYGRILR